MAQGLVTGTYLTNIANAIRQKLGVDTTYTPAQMASAIESIGSAELGSKNITANGTYTASDDGYDGYSEVTVNVASSSTLVSKTITANGTYDPADDSADGYSSVTVNVSGGGGNMLSGSTAPTSSQGSDGDYYEQTIPIASGVSFVEYLQSSGTQYIDTGLTADEGTDFYCKATHIGDYHTFGVRTGSSDSASNMLMVAASGSQMGALKTTSAIKSVDFRPSASSGTAYEMKTKTLKTTSYFWCVFVRDGEGLYSREKQESFTSNGTMIIFGTRVSGSVNLGTAKIHRLVIYQDGQIVRDYLPCLDGNGVACMWENVSGQYVYNDGTGDFSYGSTTTPDALDAVVWHKVNGTWEIVG